LDSILNQSYKNFEIIIVDHNSSDDTEKIIQSYRSEKIKYFLYKKKKNIAAVRNFGVEKSQGEYIFFTDSDCMVAKNWIEEGMNTLIKDEIAGVEGKTVAEHQNFGASQHFVENYSGGQYQTCNIAYKKKFLVDCGMFNEKYSIAYEDIDLAIRIKKKNIIIFNTDMLVFHQLVKWTIKGLISNSLRGKDKVMLVKDHNYHQILKFRIIEVNSLIIVFLPFLLIFYYRIKNLSDLCILPLLYIRAFIHRLVVWKAAITNKILIF
jgi:glycosyltransferase involved in cell wall biosynthesis